MSYSIVPNPKLTCGYLLILTDRSGDSKRIACHNRATAEYELRAILYSQLKARQAAALLLS